MPPKTPSGTHKSVDGMVPIPLSWAGVVKKSPPPKKSPASPKKSPTRASKRLRGEEPEDDSPLPDSDDAVGFVEEDPLDFKKEEVQGRTPEGVVTHKLFKVHAKAAIRRLWGKYAERGPEHFFPGQIIRATDATPQTFAQIPLDDPYTAVHKEGPIYAKNRPMVVLWKTERELLCLPIRSLKHSKKNMSDKPERWQEFFSITTPDDKHWKGDTPWAGRPLIFTAIDDKSEKLGPRTYVELARPVSVQMQSELCPNLGRLSGGDYCRLMQAYAYAQALYKEKAFEEYGQVARLPDGNAWYEGTDSVMWKQRELKMDKKHPVVVDKTTQTYKLE